MDLPFESGQLAGSSDVYAHEIPGGQYTNLLYQSKQLGLDERPQPRHERARRAPLRVVAAVAVAAGTPTRSARGQAAARVGGAAGAGGGARACAG